MTHQEILTKAIEKAIAGGWECPISIHPQDYENYDWPDRGFHDYSNDSFVAIETLIFNHDFAKALWGDGNTCAKCKGNDSLMGKERGVEHFMFVHDMKAFVMPTWQYHLQQMVIADDPLVYLGGHL